MNVSPITKASSPPKASFLSRLQKGIQDKPLRVVIYGPEGVGKSTFASQAPAPVWLGADRGTLHLDVSRLPEPSTWEDVRGSIRELTTEPHEFRTLVVDPVNWLEPMCWRFICERDGKPNIEEYGYGKGYKAALIEWRILARDLEELSDKRGMNIVIVAHSQTRKLKSPDVEDYDRYSLAMHEEAAALFRQWSDYVLFVRRHVFAKATDQKGRFIGQSNGTRTLQTAFSAAFDAKSRPQLPDPLPFPEHGAWATFIRARDWVATQLASKRTELDALLTAANPADAAKVRAYIAEDPNDAGRYDEVITALKTTPLKTTTPKTTALKTIETGSESQTTEGQP